jgi:hypothetical protein
MPLANSGWVSVTGKPHRTEVASALIRMSDPIRGGDKHALRLVPSRSQIARPSGQGRPKGALNKRTLDVIDRLAALKCDPIAGMARIAMDKKTPFDIRARMFSELAQYVAPKRKALEHSGDGGMIEALLARIDG